MQLFLPFPDIKKSLTCLSKQRAFKQAVEARQILNIIDGVVTKGWQNHPAVRMIRGYRSFLVYYYNSSLIESKSRGIKLQKLKFEETPLSIEYPWWFGDDKFHKSHKANLWRKAYDDAEGVKRDGSKKKPNKDQLDTLIANSVECPVNFREIDYFWPV